MELSVVTGEKIYAKSKEIDENSRNYRKNNLQFLETEELKFFE